MLDHNKVCLKSIRIEPDWNVKKREKCWNTHRNFIRIEPNWNVKMTDRGIELAKNKLE